MGTIFSCFQGDEQKNTTNKDSNKQTNNAQAQEVSQRDITVLKLKAVQDRLLAQKKALTNNSDKAQAEAKQHVTNKNKERAMFALKRKKLYDQYLTDTENQYAIVQKSIMDVESAIMTSTYVEVLKNTNDLIKEIESAGHLEQLQEIGADIREREERTREFNKLFEENNVGEVDDLFRQFEQEVEDEDTVKISTTKKQEVPRIKEPQHHKQEEEQEEAGDEEINNKLAMLA